MNQPIIVVSGLPRSGTSLMMQMLDRGGVEVVTDHVRSPDADNPRGYYELEKVKRIKQDGSWLPAARGKALKMVSQLLYDLPACERYRIVFMQRELDEILLSQEKMLERSGRPAAPREEMKRAFSLHLERLHAWLVQQSHIEVLRVDYAELVEHPQRHSRRVSTFLGEIADAEQMAGAIDPSLYRNRKDNVPSTPYTGHT